MRGEQRPRICSIPPRISSAGREAVALAKSAGLILDPWEAFVLDAALGERADGKWAAFEVGLIVSRQNGKGSILEARELAGLFLFGEQLIIHTAHQFNTAQEAFRRIRTRIEQTPDLDRLVAKIDESHGEEGIELLTGQRLRFLARSGSSGRGFSGDLLIYDEAMPLNADDVAATLPTLSARTWETDGGPQVWYTASAGNRKSTQLARVRRRGTAYQGTGVMDPTLTFLEWSIDPHTDQCAPDCDQHDPPDTVASYAKANPGLGYRLTVEVCEREAAAMGGHQSETFARERLGVGTYPVDEDGWAVIPKRWWTDTIMTGAARPQAPAFGVAVAPDHSSAAIGIAGALPDGRVYLEIPEGCHRPGTSWVAGAAAGMDQRWRPEGWTIDKRAATGALIQSFEDAELNVLTPTVTEIGHGCGQLYIAFKDGTVGHADDRALRTGLAGAASRRLSGAWVWDERACAADATPICAITLAFWAHLKFGGDYDASKSVSFDLAEIIRYCQLGVYDTGDLQRLYSEGLLDDEGLTVLAAAGIRVPAVLPAG